MNMIIPSLAACALALAVANATAQDNQINKDKQYQDPAQKMQQRDKIKNDYQSKQKLDLEGLDVYTLTGEKIGDVDKVVKSRNGKMAVIGLEGSLKEVAVPLGELQWQSDRLTLNSTKEVLKSRSDVDMGDFEELKPGEYTRNEFSRFEEKMDGTMKKKSDKVDNRTDFNEDTKEDYSPKNEYSDDEAEEKSDY